MHLEIIIIGIVVGIANFISRFAPFWFLQRKQGKQTHQGHVWIAVAMGSIGISAICSMLMVASLPAIIENPHKIFAMICGFTILTIVYFYSKRIVMATLVAALCYGLVFTYFPF